MAGLSKYEKTVLGLTAGFVLLTGLWLYRENIPAGEYQVTTLHRRAEEQEETLVQPEKDTWPDSLLPGERIDVNTADAYDLQRLPGIGEKRAQDILRYREEHGEFQTLDELEQVSGIGPGILEELRLYAVAGGSGQKENEDGEDIGSR